MQEGFAFGKVLKKWTTSYSVKKQNKLINYTELIDKNQDNNNIILVRKQSRKCSRDIKAIRNHSCFYSESYDGGEYETGF